MTIGMNPALTGQLFPNTGVGGLGLMNTPLDASLMGMLGGPTNALLGGIPNGMATNKTQSQDSNMLMMMVMVMAVLFSQQGNQKAPARQAVEQAPNREETADRNQNETTEDRREPRDERFQHPEQTRWDADGNILLGRNVYEQIKQNPANAKEIVEVELRRATGVPKKKHYWEVLSIIFRNQLDPFRHAGKASRGHFNDVVNALATFYVDLAAKEG